MTEQLHTPTLKEVVDILRKHNKWRRGDEPLEMCSPVELGKAIDIICNTHETLVEKAKLVDDLVAALEHIQSLAKIGAKLPTRANFARIERLATEALEAIDKL